VSPSPPVRRFCADTGQVPGGVWSIGAHALARHFHALLAAVAIPTPPRPRVGRSQAGLWRVRRCNLCAAHFCAPQWIIRMHNSNASGQSLMLIPLPLNPTHWKRGQWAGFAKPHARPPHRAGRACLASEVACTPPHGRLQPAISPTLVAAMCQGTTPVQPASWAQRIEAARLGPRYQWVWSFSRLDSCDRLKDSHRLLKPFSGPLQRLCGC
jgi:hypothetical protein